MNLLKFSMCPSYYVKHPLAFFREIRRSIKYAWQRATKGYSFYDSMDMDEFLLHIIPGMLRDIANADAYPGLSHLKSLRSGKTGVIHLRTYLNLYKMKFGEKDVMNMKRSGMLLVMFCIVILI